MQGTRQSGSRECPHPGSRLPQLQESFLPRWPGVSCLETPRCPQARAAEKGSFPLAFSKAEFLPWGNRFSRRGLLWRPGSLWAGLPPCRSLAGLLQQAASGPPGALPDATLSPQSPSTWKDVGLLTAMPTAPEPTGADNPTVSTSVLPTGEAPEDREAVLLAKVEPGFTGREKETPHPPGESTPHPTTHRASTVRATTAAGPATSHPHRDMQPEHHEPSAGPRQLDPHTPHVEDRGPSATERAAEDGVSTQLPVGEGSGEQVSAPRCRPLCFHGAWCRRTPAQSSGTPSTLCPVSMSHPPP